jgi:hypothetical protein
MRARVVRAAALVERLEVLLVSGAVLSVERRAFLSVEVVLQVHLFDTDGLRAFLRRQLGQGLYARFYSELRHCARSVWVTNLAQVSGDWPPGLAIDPRQIDPYMCPARTERNAAASTDWLQLHVCACRL